MNDAASWLAGALGITLAFAFLFCFLLAAGLIAFALRRRAYRRGTHPLRLLPWYLGGPPEAPLVLPDDRPSPKRTRDRRHDR